MKFEITDSAGKFPVLTIFLFTDSTLLVFLQPPLFFLLCFVLFVSSPAHILCLTAASGETRNGASPKYGHFCFAKLSVVTYVRTVINPELDILLG
jgi:hypothetical protein